jgi:tetratricopeptide (TPR) repeat protein
MFPEANKKSLGRATENLSTLSAEDRQRIISNLNSTLWFGILTGFLGIIGYSLNLQKAGWKILFLFILIASASYISGFFFGFLFGIPRRNTDKESNYNLSTNLGDISDWLTKIIIGLGLIEIKKIPDFLMSIGNYIQTSVGAEDSVKIFSVCSIVYFSIFGLYYGHNYTRLFLSGLLKEADDNLLQRQIKLSETGEVLNNQDLSPDNLDQSSLDKVNEYNQLLKSTKTENDYTFDDWYYKGISAYDNKDYNKTIAYMNNALEKDSKAKNAPDAYLYMSLAYGALKLYSKSIEINNIVVNSYKDYSYLYLAYHNNGVNFTDLAQYENALKQFESATSLNPDYADSWVGKGYALMYLDRFDEALTSFDRAIKINAADPNPWYNKACIFAKENKNAEAIENLKKAIELKPEFRQNAKTDSWFDNIKDGDDFKKLLN